MNFKHKKKFGFMKVSHPFLIQGGKKYPDKSSELINTFRSGNE